MKVLLTVILVLGAVCGSTCRGGDAADEARQAVAALEAHASRIERLREAGAISVATQFRDQLELLEARILLAQAESRVADVPLLLDKLVKVHADHLAGIKRLLARGITNQREVRALQRELLEARIRLADAHQNHASVRDYRAEKVAIEAAELQDLEAGRAGGFTSEVEVTRQRLVLARVKLALEQHDAGP